MASDTTTIKTMIEGTEVEGELTVHSECDFSITINKPFTGRTGGSHIPLFLKGYECFSGDYHEKRVLEVLRELYEKGPVQN